MPSEFACEVLTPYRRFFSGKVSSVAFTTVDGEMEILADHEPIVAPVRVGVLRIRGPQIDKVAAVSEGFVRSRRGKVDLFVEAAEWPEEIDRERAEQALGRATKRLATETLSWKIDESRRAAARAQNRLAVVAGESSPPPPVSVQWE